MTSTSKDDLSVRARHHDTENEITLKTSDLTKTFKNVTALNKVTLQIKSREIIGLIGPNGAGKTTFIKILLGLLRPTRGDAWIFGRHCFKESLKVRKIIGFTHTNPRFPSRLTPLQYFNWVSQIYDIETDLTHQRVRQLARLLDLDEESLNRRISTFSSGMLMKIALIQAFLPENPFVIMDEPTANLDPKARIKLFDLIKKKHENNHATFLISSHSLHELEHVCTWFILIEKGHLLWSGPKKALAGQSLTDFYMEKIGG